MKLEIDHFRALGRGEDVIPVLVDGEPAFYNARDPASTPNAAFPANLQSNEELSREDVPLAPDLRDIGTGEIGGGFENALLQVIARILDVRLPELTQRHMEAERSRRKTRNRVISALSVLLVFSILGGTAALIQKRAADYRLTQAMDSAARQVDLASSFRDRFGVPSSVALELFNGADVDLGRIVKTVRNNPALIFERAKYHRGMAELASDVDGSELSAIEQFELAETDLIKAEDLASRWYAELWFQSVPSRSRLLGERLLLLDLKLRTAEANQKESVKHAIAAEISLLTDELSSPTAAGNKTVNHAFNLCTLGRLWHSFGNRTKAQTAYRDCVALSEQVWKSNPNIAARRQFALALLELAELVRLEPDSVEQSLALINRADALLPETIVEQSASNDMRLLAVVAAGTRGDTLNLAGREPRQRLEVYERGASNLKALLDSDANRIDWQLQRAEMVYRLVTLRVQMSKGDELQSVLSENVSESSRQIELLQALVGRFPDDAKPIRYLSAFLEARAELTYQQWQAVTSETQKAILQDGLREDIGRVVAMREDAATKEAAGNVQKRDLAHAQRLKAILLSRIGDPLAETLPLFDSARRSFRELEKIADMQPYASYDLALTEFLMAEAHFSKANFQSGCQALDRSGSIMYRLVKNYPETRIFSQDVKRLERTIEENCSGITEGGK